MCDTAERGKIEAPSVRDMSALNDFLVGLDELSRASGIVITTKFRVGRSGDDFTLLTVSRDHDARTYRVTPLTIYVSKGGAA